MALDAQENKDLVSTQPDEGRFSLVGLLRNSRLSTLFSGREKETDGKRLKFENGDTLVGDLVYSFPDDFSRHDEISFDGVIESPDGTRNYKRLVAVFTGTGNRASGKMDPVIWSGAKEIWGDELKDRVVEAVKGVAASHKTIDADELISDLEGSSASAMSVEHY